MRDYFTESKYVLNRVVFDYLNGRYEGRGALTWSPHTGFHLEAFTNRRGSPLPVKMEFGGTYVSRKQDYHRIRMEFEHPPLAYAPDVLLHQRIDLIHQNHLAVDINRVIFVYPPLTEADDSYWYGSGQYRTANQLRLPSLVKAQTKVGRRTITSHSSLSGIRYWDETRRSLTGAQSEGQCLELNWRLPKARWSRTQCWRWAEALQDALSILYGQTVYLVRRSMIRNGREYVEVRWRPNTQNLGTMSLYGHVGWSSSQIVTLADFLVRDQTRGDICSKIFNQVLEASRQRSWEARELLLATILEAALRTYKLHPFRRGDQSWDLCGAMCEFRSNHLTDRWKKHCQRAIETFVRLRHRNAHLDWLIGPDRPSSDAEFAESLDDMIYLCRFYGYMILAMAGFKGLSAQFPKPHLSWSPLFSLSHVDVDSLET